MEKESPDGKILVANMKCIACGHTAERTAIRADIEAAFCENHYPKQEIQITIMIWQKKL